MGSFAGGIGVLGYAMQKTYEAEQKNAAKEAADAIKHRKSEEAKRLAAIEQKADSAIQAQRNNLKSIEDDMILSRNPQQADITLLSAIRTLESRVEALESEVMGLRHNLMTNSFI